MTAPDRLVSALSDRYRLERELGQGDVATVYLAQDLKHRRKVVLTVRKLELAHRAVPSSVGSTAEHSGGRHGDQA